ncbi:hypothetical protein L195_g045794 [Trifolium pratense]|uniref:Uncharacterized protein n=1 Tax=Trifolium pratense TaxID=57577 RepID=A0A2K3MFV7_TRIPR|nr:hypothetical protein L195_g045794 [Trifolium pratense]
MFEFNNSKGCICLIKQGIGCPKSKLVLSNIGHGVDCSGRLFDNRHGQFVKDGGTMVFMAVYNGRFLSFCHGLSSAIDNNGRNTVHHKLLNLTSPNEVYP